MATVEQRDPMDVIDAIVKQVPRVEVALLGRLADLRETCTYTAPEALCMVWSVLCAILNDELTVPPVADWECRIDDIMRGRVRVRELLQ